MSITISLKSKSLERDVVIPVEWKDISVKYWGELSSIIKKHYKNASNEKEVNINKTNTLLSNLDSNFNQDFVLNDIQLVTMNADIFAYMTGLTREEVSLIDVDKVTEVIAHINTLTEEYIPEGVRSFKLDGETYYFPSEFLREGTYGDYIESTQLEMYIKEMDNGRYDVLPDQMAILCRRIDEEYDESLIPEKADKFRKLTMDIIWEFSFFLNQQNSKLAIHFHTYSEKLRQAQEL